MDVYMASNGHPCDEPIMYMIAQARVRIVQNRREVYNAATEEQHQLCTTIRQLLL